MSNTTPLADTFRVCAVYSRRAVWTTTGNVSGNRTAQRTSCPGTDSGILLGNMAIRDLAALFI
jgi:hypothetical protein